MKNRINGNNWERSRMDEEKYERISKDAKDWGEEKIGRRGLR